jgi:AcrR family transcriptional regulator
MDSKEEIIEATCKALEKHGYSDLSVQKIADEFNKSKSLLYHHYDGKDEILLDFMEHQLKNYREEAEKDNGKDTKEEFRDKAFMAFGEEKNMKGFVEIRTEGLRDERFRNLFKEFSEAYRNKLQELIRKGQEEGIFQEADAEKVSKFIDIVNREVIFSGALEEESEEIREELEFYLDQKVFR